MKTMMMTAAAALAMIAAPAMAQTTTAQPASPDGSMAGMSTPGTSTSDMATPGMATPGMKPMSKSQMAMMHKCQAMTPEMMAKNKSCTKMAKMHPEMMSGSPAPM